MIKINSVSWGKIEINNQVYHQVLLVGGKVIERDKPKLEKIFGTTHKIGDWEQQLLFSEKPEIILIATGWNGILKIEQKLKAKIERQGIELRTVLTSSIVNEYNRLVEKGKRVNALIHTTC